MLQLPRHNLESLKIQVNAQKLNISVLKGIKKIVHKNKILQDNGNFVYVSTSR